AAESEIGLLDSQLYHHEIERPSSGCCSCQSDTITGSPTFDNFVTPLFRVLLLLWFVFALSIRNADGCVPEPNWWVSFAIMCICIPFAYSTPNRHGTEFSQNWFRVGQGIFLFGLFTSGIGFTIHGVCNPYKALDRGFYPRC
ncbi:hypothetical protein BVRB_036640, partial [Beta vulgaris subsp. vulgaris]